MSCIASAVNLVIASASTSRNMPSGVSTVRTPSVVTNRYSVSSGPSGKQFGVGQRLIGGVGDHAGNGNGAGPATPLPATAST